MVLTEKTTQSLQFIWGMSQELTTALTTGGRSRDGSSGYVLMVCALRTGGEDVKYGDPYECYS